MREDRDFDKIVEGLGVKPQQTKIAPPSNPSLGERSANVAKVVLATIVLFLLQVSVLSLSIMVIHSAIIEEFDLAVDGIGFIAAAIVSAMAMVIIAVLRRSTA